MRSITIFFILSFVPSDAMRRIGGRAALSELDHGSVNRSNTGCDVFDFIDFNIGGSGSILSGTGGLRKQASALCTKTYGIRGTVRTENNYEAGYMQEKCKEGVQIGKALCEQTTQEGPSIVPLDIIDHFDAVESEYEEYTAEAKAWNKWTQSMCKKDPKPAWTGFEDCYHGCQYMYVDCKQARSCKICLDKAEIDAGICHGIRKKTVYTNGSRTMIDWTVPPPPKYTFLDACVEGCSIYTDLKKQNGGGPACKIGDVISMKRTMIAFSKKRTMIAFSKRCTDSGGVEDFEDDEQVCLCDRAQGLECMGPVGRVGDRSSSSMRGCLLDDEGSGFINDCPECRCARSAK